ncbi:MAG: bifunctional folylpolyglutamate synthase/dihydrofolate synthase [Parvularculaceae bacterium]|nr:bifunctional folylpolyglutamate synthase/dihydrofolate synthase [Parvularculaceae bacterium]
MADPLDVLARLAERRPVLIDLGLERMLAALARLGDPHKRLPPTLHVAGTNGKGSTCAYLRAILEANGHSVHVFTSPHLVRFNERIVVAGREISDEALADVLIRCDVEVGSKALTFFEATTCAAFLAFAETPADYLVLEVGLGGRLDATNVVDNPLVTAITPVGLDHMQFLGDTVEKIAFEKAGILKRGAPAAIGPQTPGALDVIERQAARVGAPLFAYGSSWTAWSEQGRLLYQDDDGLSDLDAPRLLGQHQILNAGLAVATAKAAGLGLSDKTLSQGVAAARWPARMQRLRSGPIVALAEAAGDPEVWLDGGHNPHAAKALAAVLADLEEKAPKRLALIAGMQSTKDQSGFFAPFKGVAAEVLTVKADHEGAADAGVVAEAAERAGLPARPAASVEDAARRIFADGRPTRLLICGSLYLAGEVLRAHA